MALSEIEKLERRYAENPQGLTFAPLAEVHRKNGEVQRALDLLGPGLALHPDYIPASIVLGRCHLDLGDVPAAEKAFLHVLSLDGENVIAIKALADISERLLRFDDAERWLHTLISLDRSNDEAREQLQRVEVARRQTEVGSVAEPPSGQETPSAAEEESALAMREPFDEPAVARLEEPAGLHVDEQVRDDEEVQPLEGLVGREVDVPDETGGEFRVETSEDIVLRSVGGNEFQVPDASLELFAGGDGRERAPFEEDALLPEDRAATSEPAPEPMIVGWGERVEEPEPVREPEPEPELSMAEPEPALPEPALPEPAAAKVEPEPAPPEPRPIAAVSELESAAVIVPEPASAASEPEAVPIDHYPAPTAAAQEPSVPPAAPKRAYAASETGGRPVAQLLKDILSARPPTHSAPPPVRQAPASGGSGAPTRPAADALSLSSVFGEEEAPGTPPAVPAAGTGTGVSYDDFFGAPGATPTQRGNRAPDPKNDDLDQFHAWLQNLKR